MEYIIAFCVAVGINLILFVPAFFFKTDKLTDFSYALSFFVVSAVLLFSSEKSPSQVLLFLLVSLWALRLGLYLFIRIKKIKKDNRFDEMREKFWSFFKFWLLQGVTVFVVLLSSVIYYSNSPVSISSIAIFGILIFLIGLLIESVADYQKYTFINNEENKGKWIDTGLWKFSRHPNYFGEILVWIGLYVYVLPSLQGIDVLIGLLSPLFIAALIIFVSGIPLLEQGAEKRWGSDPKYQKYKKNTSSLVLLPNKHEE